MCGEVGMVVRPEWNLFVCAFYVRQILPPHMISDDDGPAHCNFSSRNMHDAQGDDHNPPRQGIWWSVENLFSQYKTVCGHTQEINNFWHSVALSRNYVTYRAPLS